MITHTMLAPGGPSRKDSRTEKPVSNEYGSNLEQTMHRGYPVELHQLLEQLFRVAEPATDENRMTLTETFRTAAAYVVENSAGEHNDLGQTIFALGRIGDRHPALAREVAETISGLYKRLDAPSSDVARMAASMLLYRMYDSEQDVRLAAATGLIAVAADIGRIQGDVPKDVANALKVLETYEPDAAVKDKLAQAGNALQRATYEPLRQAASRLKTGKANGFNP